jgi:hypothetical protein
MYYEDVLAQSVDDCYRNDGCSECDRGFYRMQKLEKELSDWEDSYNVIRDNLEKLILLTASKNGDAVHGYEMVNYIYAMCKECGVDAYKIYNEGKVA